MRSRSCVIALLMLSASLLLPADPKEEHALSYEGQYAWIRFPAGKILTDHLVSLKKYPPVPPGAADPYVPAAAANDANVREPTIEGND